MCQLGLFLKNSFQVNITVVELDPLMVSVAYKWFGVKDSDHHHVVIQDGLDFLKVATKTGNSTSAYCIS